MKTRGQEAGSKSVKAVTSAGSSLVLSLSTREVCWWLIDLSRSIFTCMYGLVLWDASIDVKCNILCKLVLYKLSFNKVWVHLFTVDVDCHGRTTISFLCVILLFFDSFFDLFQLSWSFKHYIILLVGYFSF